MAESLCCAFDCSGLCFYSFSWSLCLHLIISSWNSCGFSKKNDCFSWKPFIFFCCSPLMSDAFEMGFSSAGWARLADWLFHAFPESQARPEGVTCSGVHSVPTSTIFVTWEDWPLPQVVWQSHWLVSLVQYSHYIFHRLPHGQNTVCLVSSQTLKQVMFYYQKHHHHNTYQDLPGTARRTGTCLRLSEITAEQHTDVLGPPGR